MSFNCSMCGKRDSVLFAVAPHSARRKTLEAMGVDCSEEIALCRGCMDKVQEYSYGGIVKEADLSWAAEELETALAIVRAAQGQLADGRLDKTGSAQVRATLLALRDAMSKITRRQ